MYRICYHTWHIVHYSTSSIVNDETDKSLFRYKTDIIFLVVAVKVIMAFLAEQNVDEEVGVDDNYSSVRSEENPSVILATECCRFRGPREFLGAPLVREHPCILSTLIDKE